MVRMRRSALTISTVALLSVFAALGGAWAASASSAAGGVNGNPQPAPKPFVIGASNYWGGSVAMEPNGSMVSARATAGGTQVVVCVLNRGASTCSSSVTLSPLGADHVNDLPDVFVPSANHVDLLMGACCDTNKAGADLLFQSTNGGRTFGPGVRVGDLGVDIGELIGSDIVFTATDRIAGAEVESLPVNASGPPLLTADTPGKEAVDVAVGSYQGGALIGSDNSITNPTTYVAYAKAGTNFDASGSYHDVASFPGEQLIAMSGGALLTVNTGTLALELRLFNGTSYGAAHPVASLTGGKGTSFTVDQDPSGRLHVFSERASSNPAYELFELTSANGVTWSSPVNLGNAIDSNMLDAVLDANGSGLVVGTNYDEPEMGYPVLSAQSATFGLKPTTIKKGKTTIASGTASPAASGRNVFLQVERAGLWYTVATTHEVAGGKFKFTIKGTTVGTFDYRAVVADPPGYALYGYSAARALKVTS
jgi:hypothetical protein